MTVPFVTGPQDPSQLNASINSLISTINANSGVSQVVTLQAPIAAELISIKAAATPANGTITIAAQPDYARRLQIRIVIGTTTTTAITAGTLTLVGVNASGQAVSEVISLIQNASATLQSTNTYATLTSGTVAAYAANGSGTGNTLGIGVSAYLGLPLAPGWSNLTVYKENVDQANETIGTVDYTSGSVSPTTAPNASHNFNFYYTFSTAE